MQEFLERTLKQKVIITPDEEIYSNLPLVYKGRYDILMINTNGVFWMAIQPKIDVGLVTLRKDWLMLEQLTGRNCAIFLEDTTFYIKERMIEEGIPFVIKGKQMYLPFIGYLLNNENERVLQPVRLISFLTQKMLLTAIYEKWNSVKVTEAAHRLDISKKSASRCFDELEYLKIDVLTMKGKSRTITICDDRKKLWEKIKNKLRNPVIREYILYEDIGLSKKAGISALCEFSLLSDNDYPTYAITKKDIRDSKINYLRQSLKMEEIGCVVLELGYFIDYKGVQDPLSVALSLTCLDNEDERISISINEMLQEYIWSKD